MALENKTKKELYEIALNREKEVDNLKRTLSRLLTGTLNRSTENCDYYESLQYDSIEEAATLLGIQITSEDFDTIGI